jgi:hypothetical protein
MKYECLIVFITLIIVSVIQIVNCKLLNQHNKIECLFYPKSLHFKQIGCPKENTSCLYSWLSTWIIFWVTKLDRWLENCIRLVFSYVNYIFRQCTSEEKSFIKSVPRLKSRFRVDTISAKSRPTFVDADATTRPGGDGIKRFCREY